MRVSSNQLSLTCKKKYNSKKTFSGTETRRLRKEERLREEVHSAGHPPSVSHRLPHLSHAPHHNSSDTAGTRMSQHRMEREKKPEF